MRWVRFGVLIILITVLQAGVLQNFRIKPDLLLVLLVFFAVYSNPVHAIITSFTIGFAADISSGSAMGAQVITLGLLGSALAYLHGVITIRRWPAQATAIFILGILAAIATHLLSILKSQPPPLNMRSILLASLFSAAVAPFLFPLLAWWMRIKTTRRRRY